MSRMLYLFLCFLRLIFALSERVTVNHWCQSSCGNITIPYPFGIGTGCFMDSWTEMECDYTHKLFLKKFKDYEVVKVSHTEVSVTINIYTTNQRKSFFRTYPGLHSSPFTFTSNNKFITVGCGIQGIIDADLGLASNFSSGCVNFCKRYDLGECQGFGCCEISIPGNMKQYRIAAFRLSALTTNITSSPIGYAFLADESYKFKVSDLDPSTKTTVGLNFVVGNQTCEYAAQDPSSFVCKENSDCISIKSNVSTGYICKCSKGYQGNPYVTRGCQDVNECKNPNRNSCRGKCFNTQGSYHCIPMIWIIFLGLILLLLGGGLGIYGRKQRQLSKLREKFFQQNGGLLLQEKISLHVGGAESTKIFTEKQLKLATNNYDQSRILGEGGFGTVYKGVLPDLKVVAIKKSKVIDKDQIEQFINEVDILTRINHRNIVKLLGCCLEIEFPLLVYEFVANGTLSQHISKKYDFLSWQDRLRIAAEIASALAYLHCSASTPIIHRDVKSSNVLLDEDLTAKVADFGASRVNPLDETQISTLVKGTLGYLDPEYMLTNHLTQQSDVYSFGVVLAELLTGEKPLSFERSPEESSLAMYFTRSMEKKRLWQILQDGIVEEANANQVEAVAELARMCLHRSGEGRPSMKEVSAELEALRGYDKKHSSSPKVNIRHVNLPFKQVELQPSSSYSSGNALQ